MVPKGCAILEAMGQATRRLKNQYSMWTLRSLLRGYTGKLWNVVIAPSGIRVFPQDNYVHDLGGWHRRGDPPHPISTGFLRHFHGYRYGLKFHIISFRISRAWPDKCITPMQAHHRSRTGIDASRISTVLPILPIRHHPGIA